MKCPNCKVHTLVIAERKGIEIDHCPECRGIWLDRGEQDKILEKVQWITPIPGGVGALTISYLMINITKAYALQKNLYFCEDSLSFI